MFYRLTRRLSRNSFRNIICRSSCSRKECSVLLCTVPSYTALSYPIQSRITLAIHCPVLSYAVPSFSQSSRPVCCPLTILSSLGLSCTALHCTLLLCSVPLVTLYPLPSCPVPSSPVLLCRVGYGALQHAVSPSGSPSVFLSVCSTKLLSVRPSVCRSLRLSISLTSTVTMTHLSVCQ